MPVAFLTNLAVPATELAKFAMAPENERNKLIGEAQELINTLHLNVSLPSGRSASLSLPLDGTVLDLKLAAQQSLGQPAAVFGAAFPQTCCPGWTTFESNGTSSRFRASKWRQHNSCSTAAQSSCNRLCDGLVVPWRWCRHMGPV